MDIQVRRRRGPGLDFTGLVVLCFCYRPLRRPDGNVIHGACLHCYKANLYLTPNSKYYTIADTGAMISPSAEGNHLRN